MQTLIDYQKTLNAAQYDAVTTIDGPVLVIAGAGSGKTRTIIYRLAYMLEMGINPASILLLTFTRKAANQMLERAGYLLGRSLHSIPGGTFHGFAYSVLRRYWQLLGFTNSLTVMSRGDAEELITKIKTDLKIETGDRKFPKKNTIISIISKARNKELSVIEVLENEASHLLEYANDLEAIYRSYQILKKQLNLLDYDDLLFYFEELLIKHENIRQSLNESYSHIMVDEYQDTNLVQARLIKFLAGDKKNIMAVGDDAQSIYAFRGANIRNIMDFPQIFSNTKLIKLECNYRSTQPILALTNHILNGARERYKKTLFSEIESNILPYVFHTVSDKTQASIVVEQIKKLEQEYGFNEIAVLFRSGYQSYPIEFELNKSGIGFRKYGGQSFSEAAHIKDVLSFLRVTKNVSDLPAWQRILNDLPGIGSKTATKIYEAILKGDNIFIAKMIKSKPDIKLVLELIEDLKEGTKSPSSALETIYTYYIPLLMKKFVDDYPRRITGLEELSQIASGYSEMESFLADLSLDLPEELDSEDMKECVTLSTIHSAKGLEYKAVLILDLVEERLPSRHALFSEDEFEEERRLLYVACTRAKEYLALCVPGSMYQRAQNRSEPTIPSQFLKNIPEECIDKWREKYGGGLINCKDEYINMSLEQKNIDFSKDSTNTKFQNVTKQANQNIFGYCSHKIFGRGKIIAKIEPNKLQINFPNFGIKLLIEDFVVLEES